MTASIIILVISILLIIEGSLAFLFPRQIKKIVSDLIKNPKKIRGYGIIELILGLILLVIAVFMRGI